MIVAEVKFGDGSVHRCTGRVKDRRSVPWTSEADAEAHVRSVREKSGVDVRLLRFVPALRRAVVIDRLRALALGFALTFAPLGMLPLVLMEFAQ